MVRIRRIRIKRIKRLRIRIRSIRIRIRLVGWDARQLDARKNAPPNLELLLI